MAFEKDQINCDKLKEVKKEVGMIYERKHGGQKMDTSSAEGNCVSNPKSSACHLLHFSFHFNETERQSPVT